MRTLTTEVDLDLLTPRQASDILGVSLMTLRRWRAAGRLPVCYLAPSALRSARYRRADILRLVQEGSTSGPLRQLGR